MVTYPNAFRIITINNYKNKVVIDIQDKETRLKDIQKLSKLLIFSSNFYMGDVKDCKSKITIKN